MTQAQSATGARGVGLGLGDENAGGAGGAGVGRRDFLGGSVLAAVASLLSGGVVGCGNGLIGSDGPTSPTSLGAGVTVKLSDYSALASVGGMARVDVAGVPLGVVRTAADAFVVVSLVCTHQGTIVSMGPSGFVCPNHGATFASDGTWVGGQPTTSLVRYPVIFDQVNGMLQIGGSVATPAASIVVQPSAVTLAPGQASQLAATARDASGATLAGRNATWSSNNTAVATVSASGLVTAVATGSATITATCDAVSATATVTVTGAPAGGLVVDPALFPALGTIGGIARVDDRLPGSLPVAVVRAGASSWVAFSMVCPHAGSTININGTGFLCPNHGAQFNASGANVGGQQTSALTSLPVTVRSDGKLVVDTGGAPAPPPGGSDDD